MIRGHHPDEGSSAHNAYYGGRWNFDGSDWVFETKSGSIIPDKHQESKKKKRPGIDGKSKKNERVSSGLVNRATAGGGTHGGNRHQSPAPRDRHKQTVELDDVKNAGLEALYGKSKYVSKEFLRGIFDAEIFDDFLMYLLHYFDCYFKRFAEEEKKANSTSIEPGRLELLDYANSIERVKIAEKQVGKSYCHLVMGIGVESSHHMACGLSRASSTVSDRYMYENFYLFCCFFIWIAFKRQHWEHIELETGRLLRSNTFNPATKKIPVMDQKEDYSKFHQNRPSVATIMHQRSPAMVAILPSPKQDATHLFTNKPLPSSGLTNLGIIEQEMQESEEKILTKTLRVGILGENMSGYYKKNLAPIEHEGEDGKDADKNTAAQAGTTGGVSVLDTEMEIPSDANAGGEKKQISREDTAVSRATTTISE